MKLPWFYAETIGAPGAHVELGPEEARHASKATRLRPGDGAVISDGQGQTARVQIQESTKGRVSGLIEEIEIWPRSRPALHLASALPKGDRLSTLLSMATQIGIHSFTPLQCERSVVPAPEHTPDRWERIVREAAKQSQQPWLPELREGQPLAFYAEAWAESARLLQLDPHGESLDPAALASAPAGPEAIALLVGPEGGFTEGESRELQSRGATTWALSTGVLRIETAAIAGLASLALIREPLRPETENLD
ncbi:MAG: RsmE family RNA methyltransferase [Myxococcota bacterium]|nr:RsmE family RNA methyltransferase [Myxococcota bacterium]